MGSTKVFCMASGPSDEKAEKLRRCCTACAAAALCLLARGVRPYRSIMPSKRATEDSSQRCGRWGRGGSVRKGRGKGEARSSGQQRLRLGLGLGLGLLQRMAKT